MYRIIILMFLMLSSASANSQGTETPEIALGFKMGEIKGFTPDQHMLLKSKVIEAVTSHQAGIYDYNLHFYLQPEFAIISKKTADGGLRKIEVVNAKLLLSIKNAMNHQIVAATSIAIQGSGISEQEALTAAVNAIEPDAPVFHRNYRKLDHIDRDKNDLPDNADRVKDKHRPVVNGGQCRCDGEHPQPHDVAHHHGQGEKGKREIAK